MRRRFDPFLLLSFVAVILLGVLFYGPELGTVGPRKTRETNDTSSFGPEMVPEYSGLGYVILNHDVPYGLEFPEDAEPFVRLSDLDYLGRCGVATGLFRADSLPKEDRGDISSVTPSGFNQAFHHACDEDFFDPAVQPGGALFHRCHLLAYAFCGLNAEPRNLVTGTCYCNCNQWYDAEALVQSALFEDGPVLVRVTPIFRGAELVCRGILFEAVSQSGDFHICRYVYNVMPGVEIFYLTGRSIEKRMGELPDANNPAVCP